MNKPEYRIRIGNRYVELLPVPPSTVPALTLFGWLALRFTHESEALAAAAAINANKLGGSRAIVEPAPAAFLERPEPTRQSA